MITLEIGKSYITGLWDPEDPTDGAIVKIIKDVSPETVEYGRGFRFVSDSGKLFTSDGRVNEITNIITDDDGDIVEVEEGGSSTSSNIISEASVEHLNNGYEEYAVAYSEDEDESLVPSDDPKFHMKLGGLYIDRIGRYRFIDRIHRFTNEEWDDGSGSYNRFMSGKEGYESDGRERGDGKLSMYDIVYQKTV